MKTLTFNLSNKLLSIHLLLVIGAFASSFNSQAETCSVKGNYKLYKNSFRNSNYIRQTTRPGTYACQKFGSNYKIKVGNTWRIVYSKAVTEKAAPVKVIQELTGASSNITTRLEDLGSNSYAVKDNYVLVDDNKKLIASTLGVSKDRQSIQFILDESGNEILNSDGRAKVTMTYLDRRGREQQKTGWISPDVAIGKTIGNDSGLSSNLVLIDKTKYREGDPVQLPETVIAEKTNPEPLQDNTSGAPTPNLPTEEPSVSSENMDSDEDEGLLQGVKTKVIKNISTYAKDDPDKASGFTCDHVTAVECKNASKITSDTELILTGERVFNKDDKTWYVKVNYSNNGEDFEGWVEENKTELNPKEELLKLATARRLEDDSTSLGVDDEVADAPSAGSQSFYEQRFTPEERARHDELASSVKNLKKEDLPGYVNPSDYPKINFPTSRGLVRLHDSSRVGFCGSAVYNQPVNGNESYAHPVSACAMAQIAEIWKKEYCPNGGGCRLNIGDISHPTRRIFDGHRSHTDGKCFDIRPMRDSGSGGLSYTQSIYNPTKTEQLLKLFKRFGGTPTYFNDPKMRNKGLSSYSGGHHNHIHVCFPNTQNQRNRCNAYKPDYKTCPKLHSFFNNNATVKAYNFKNK